MIPKAREVRVKPKVRKVLETRCRAPSTPQRDVKRARIVLLAAEGRSTRSIASEVGVEPRIVSNWRRRFADHGLAGLEDRSRASKKPIYGAATNKRILALLDKSPPHGYARWTGPLLAKALEDVDVQYVWRFLREHQIDLAARKSWCESNDPEFAAKAAGVVGLYLDRPEPRLQAARHNHVVCSPRSRHRKDHCGALQAAPPRRVPGLHEQRRRRLSGSADPRHPRQSQHPQEERALAQEAPESSLSFHPDPLVLAQPGRDLVFHSPRPVADRCFVHRGRAIAGAHRCVHCSLQRHCQAIRLDQKEGLSTALQKPPYHPAVILGTSLVGIGNPKPFEDPPLERFHALGIG